MKKPEVHHKLVAAPPEKKIVVKHHDAPIRPSPLMASKQKRIHTWVVLLHLVLILLLAGVGLWVFLHFKQKAAIRVRMEEQARQAQFREMEQHRERIASAVLKLREIHDAVLPWLKEARSLSAGEMPEDRYLQDLAVLEVIPNSIQENIRGAEECITQSSSLIEEASKLMHVDKIARLAGRTKESVDLVERDLQNAAGKREEAAKLIEKIRNSRAGWDAGKKREEEDLAAKKREEARQELIRSELAAAERAMDAARSSVRKFDFSEALKSIAKAAGAMKTDEGREVLCVELDRYRALADLKTFLIGQVNAAPFRWGWGSGNSARDVLKADEAGFELRGGKAAWSDVDETQFRKFLQQYLSNDMDRVLRSRHLLAAAIYFRVMGNNSLAQTYRTQAVQSNSNLLSEAQRLVPD